MEKINQLIEDIMAGTMSYEEFLLLEHDIATIIQLNRHTHNLESECPAHILSSKNLQICIVPYFFGFANLIV